MKKQTTLLLWLLAIFFTGGVFYYASDAQLKNRVMRQELQRLEQAVASKNLAATSAAISDLLAEEATIKLQIITAETGGKPMIEQDFTKASFLSFIGNTLYSLSDYHYTASLASVNPETNVVQFTSAESGEGIEKTHGMAITMRYHSTTGCTGRAVFTSNHAKLTELTCKIHFSEAPKITEAH